MSTQPSPAAEQFLISISDVSYRYRGGERDALAGVSFEIERGSCFGLLGPNGAGKSTLFALLTGVLALQRGEITVAGLSARRDLNGVREIGALAPQDLAFYPALTGRENLSFFAGAYRLPATLWPERLSAVVETCGLQEVLNRRVETYSGGLKRRLNLAIALLSTPQVLYLDEPTVGIDAQSRRYIVDAIAGLKAKGVTIVYTSHYMEEVEALCDALAVIDQGRVVAIGGKEELLRPRAEKVLHVTLEAAPTEAERAQWSALGARWKGDAQFDMPFADSAALGPALDQMARSGARIATMQYGVARLEQAYLAMLKQSEPE